MNAIRRAPIKMEATTLDRGSLNRLYKVCFDGKNHVKSNANSTGSISRHGEVRHGASLSHTLSASVCYIWVGIGRVGLGLSESLFEVGWLVG